MRLLNVTYLDTFIQANHQCRPAVVAWCNAVEDAEWRNPADLQLANLIYRTGDAANTFLFTVVPKLCVVETRVNFALGSVLVTKTWSEQDFPTPARRRLAN